MSRAAYILTVKRMNVKSLFRSRKIIIDLAVSAGGIAAALIYADECRRGMENGIGFCLNVLIPSLFFFMAVSSYIVQSGAAQIICRPFTRLSQALFRLPEQSLAVILLSMIGGYPIGASCAAILSQDGRLSPSQAAKTAYIAVAAGPGFLISFIGGSLLNEPRAGVILLTAQCIAVLLTGVIVGHAVKSEPLPHTAAHIGAKKNLLIASVHSASKAAFHMCSMVIVFSAVIEVSNRLIRNRVIGDLLSAAVEVTNGCARLSGDHPLYITAFFVGFGGLSVHFQIFATLGELPVHKGLFFIFRIIEGIIMMAATYIYLMAAPVTLSVFHPAADIPSAARSATMAGSAALVISSLFFLSAISSKSSQQKQS